MTDALTKTRVRPFLKRIRLKYEGKTKDYNIWVREDEPKISLYFIEKNLFFGATGQTGGKLNESEGNLFYNYAVVNTLKLFESLPTRLISVGWQVAPSVLMIRRDPALSEINSHYLDFGIASLAVPKSLQDLAQQLTGEVITSYSELGSKLANPVPPDYPVWGIAVLAKMQQTSTGILNRN